MSVVFWQAVAPKMSRPFIQSIRVIIRAGPEGAQKVCAAVHCSVLSKTILLLQNLYNLNNLKENIYYDLLKKLRLFIFFILIAASKHLLMDMGLIVIAFNIIIYFGYSGKFFLKYLVRIKDFEYPVKSHNT